jgi:hypothetical protein
MTVIVALVNARSVMRSVHDEFGQSGAPGIGVVGGWVVTANVTLPFLTSLAGMDWLPVTCTGAGFCPGTLQVPEGLQHCPVGLALADKITSTSPLPSPVREAVELSVSPASLNAGSVFGPPLRCTFAATASTVQASNPGIMIAYILLSIGRPSMVMIVERKIGG